MWVWAAERYVPTCEMGLRCICGVDDMTACEVMEGCAVLGSHAPRNGGDTHRVAQAHTTAHSIVRASVERGVHERVAARGSRCTEHGRAPPAPHGIRA